MNIFKGSFIFISLFVKLILPIDHFPSPPNPLFHHSNCGAELSYYHVIVIGKALYLHHPAFISHPNM